MGDLRWTQSATTGEGSKPRNVLSGLVPQQCTAVLLRRCHTPLASFQGSTTPQQESVSAEKDVVGKISSRTVPKCVVLVFAIIMVANLWKSVLGVWYLVWYTVVGD